ncbi:MULTISPECIES: hypothetical protein [Cupriavidus]
MLNRLQVFTAHACPVESALSAVCKVNIPAYGNEDGEGLALIELAEPAALLARVRELQTAVHYYGLMEARASQGPAAWGPAAQAQQMGYPADKRKRRRYHRITARNLLAGGGFFNAYSARARRSTAWPCGIWFRRAISVAERPFTLGTHMNTLNAPAALALDLMNLLVSRGLSLENTARALGVAAKMIAVHHETVDGRDDAVDLARAELVEGYETRVSVGMTDMSALKAAYSDESAEAIFANAHLRVVKH